MIIISTYILASYPSPLISRDFILAEMASLTQIEIMKKVRWKGLETSLYQNFKIPSRELSYGGGIRLHLPESKPSIFLKNSTTYALTAALTRSWSGFDSGWPGNFVWSDVSRLSYNFVPSPHYSLFVTSIFILVHTYTIESHLYICACMTKGTN
jgi:hypothetical protein